MAIRVIGKIILFESLSQSQINDLINSDDTIVFQLEQTCSNDVRTYDSLILDADLTGFSTDYLQAIKDLNDRISFKFFENACCYNIDYNEISKVFDLRQSFVKTDIDTSASQGSIVTGQMLEAYFITPGIDSNVFTKIDLPYGNSISTADEAKMLNIGLELNLGGTGSLFSIKTQKVPFKVMFVKPDVVPEKYIIKFNKENQLIEI